MKIDIHSVVMGWTTSPCFYECIKEQLTKLVENYYKDKKVKCIQFYSDFYNTNGDYPYIKNDLIYYPLTIIFYNKSYDVLWVRWNYVGRKKEDIYKFPFCSSENVVFEICEDVDDNFKNSIEGKKLVYLNNKLKPLPVIHIEKLEGIGKVNQAFVDVLVEHIEKILLDNWNIVLNNRWDLYICAEDKTIQIDNRKYRKVTAIDGYGWACTFGVMWQEDYDVSDFVEYDKITFSLVDLIPGEKISSTEKFLEFLKEQIIVNSQQKQTGKGLGIWSKVD